MPTLKESLLAQIDGLMAEFGSIPIFRDPMRNIRLNEFAYGAVAAIQRATGANSTQSIRAREIAQEQSQIDSFNVTDIGVLYGILISVRKDVAGGYLDEATTLIRAEVFSDLLEQAEYLLSEGYKDPAAVVCGGVLETHLRNLCVKAGIDVLKPDKKPKRADALNAELVKAKSYSSLEQKEVTALLGLRNSAAHGQYNEYDSTQVQNMVHRVRGFVARNPA